MLPNRNFYFLAGYEQLFHLSALAERYYADDPSTALIKLRQYGETMAQIVAAKSGLFVSLDEMQIDLLRRLCGNGILPPDISGLFHDIRIAGNRAAHRNAGTHTEALSALKMSRELGVWFHRTFTPEPDFIPEEFMDPALGMPVQTGLPATGVKGERVLQGRNLTSSLRSKGKRVTQIIRRILSAFTVHTPRLYIVAGIAAEDFAENALRLFLT